LSERAHQLLSVSNGCYQLCVDAEELAELEAAIAAHCEVLKADGVKLPVSPEQLHVIHLMELPLTGTRPPVARALITNLRALASLRTRATIREHRAKDREDAERAARNAEPDHQSTARRRAKQVNLLMDSSQFERLAPTLRSLRSRSRGARKKLEAFGRALDARHRQFVHNELAHASGAVLDRALTGWLSTRCAALEQELEFFLAEIEGPIAIEPTGHSGVADNKAWHRVRGEGLVMLEEAGVKPAERRALFPGTRPGKQDDPSEQRQREREYQARRRAKKRRKSKS